MLLQEELRLHLKLDAHLIDLICLYSKEWQNKLVAQFAIPCNDISIFFCISLRFSLCVYETSHILLYDNYELQCKRSFDVKHHIHTMIRLNEDHFVFSTDETLIVFDWKQWNIIFVFSSQYKIEYFKGTNTKNAYAFDNTYQFLGECCEENKSILYRWCPKNNMLTMVGKYQGQPVCIRNGDVYTTSKMEIVKNGLPILSIPVNMRDMRYQFSNDECISFGGNLLHLETMKWTTKKCEWLVPLYNERFLLYRDSKIFMMQNELETCFRINVSGDCYQHMIEHRLFLFNQNVTYIFE